MASVFGYVPSGSRFGNVPNELVHRTGPPFLDNYYCGYQYSDNGALLVIVSQLWLLSGEPMSRWWGLGELNEHLGCSFNESSEVVTVLNKAIFSDCRTMAFRTAIGLETDTLRVVTVGSEKTCVEIGTK